MLILLVLYFFLMLHKGNTMLELALTEDYINNRNKATIIDDGSPYINIGGIVIRQYVVIFIRIIIMFLLDAFFSKI